MGWSVFPPMFAGGMIAYQLLARKDAAMQWPELPSWLWPMLLMAFFVVPPSLMGDLEMFSPRAAVVNSCSCMLLGFSIAFFREISARWLVCAAHRIAKYSYGVYLLHVPVIFFVFRYLPHLPQPLRIALVLLLTGAVSFVAFHTIEDPLIHLGKRLTKAGAGVLPSSRPVRAAVAASSRIIETERALRTS